LLRRPECGQFGERAERGGPFQSFARELRFGRGPTLRLALLRRLRGGLRLLFCPGALLGRLLRGRRLTCRATRRLRQVDRAARRRWPTARGAPALALWPAALRSTALGPFAARAFTLRPLATRRRTITLRLCRTALAAGLAVTFSFGTLVAAL